VIFRPYRAVTIDEYYFVFCVQALKGRNIIGVGVALPMDWNLFLLFEYFLNKFYRAIPLEN